MGHTFEWAVRHRTVQLDGTVEQAPCGQCLSNHAAPIERIGAAFRSYCYRTGKRVEIAAEAVAAVRPNAGEFARALARALNARGQVIERSKGRLWELGWLEVEGKPRALFLCRDIGFAQNLSTVTDHLDAKASKWAGVILCTGSTPAGIALKHGHTFRPLRECVGFNGEDISIDICLIESWAQGLRRPRTYRAALKTEEAREWLPPAERFWKELHAKGRLNWNARAMSRVVIELLGGMKPPLAKLPELSTVYKQLLPNHRRHYPSRRRQNRD